VTVFEDSSVSEALERSIKNAKHLRAKHSATIAAARALARKIDAWDVIVEWALDDAAQGNGRPAVPANDNVSIASFLKYLDALGLTPGDEESAVKAGSAARPPSGVLAFRQRSKTG